MRKVLSQVVFGVAAMLLLLAGCSGGGGGDTPPAEPPLPIGITITGVVTAPAGQVAKLQNKNIFYALVEQLLPAAEAAVNGVSVVTSATVTAVQVDASGNVLVTLGSATTDSRGRYVLSLPADTVLAPTIQVRVQGGGTMLRAPVVQELVDITPASEWLLQQLSSESVALDSVNNDDLLFLQAILESYTVNAGGDVATTLTNLAPLRAMIVAEIAAVKANAVAQPSFAGTWVMSGNDVMVGNVSSFDVNGLWISGQWLNTLSDYTVTLGQLSGNSYSVTMSGVESETSQYAHGSKCAFSAVAPYVTNCTFQSYNWGGDDIFHETRTLPAVTGVQRIFALDDGRVVLPYAAQETVEAGDMFAYVTPPYAEVLMPMGGDGVMPDAYAGIATWPTFAYALTSDNKADRTQLRGGSGDIKPMALIKQGSGLTSGALTGRYAYVAFNHDLASNGDRRHSIYSGIFDADGSGALGNGFITGAELARVVNNSTTATLTGSPLSAAITGGSYTVASDGTLTLNLTTDVANQPPALTGRVNGAGNFFYVRAAEADTLATPQSAVHTLVFGIKVGTAAPALSGKSYRFRGSELEYGAGSYARYGHLAYSTLTFNSDGTVAVTLNSQEIDRNNDVTSIVSHPAVMGASISGTYLTYANGAFTIALADGTVIRGYVNAKSMLAIQQRGFQASGPVDLTNGSGMVGLAMGRCVVGC